jgi:hypothetical protein
MPAGSIQQQKKQTKRKTEFNHIIRGLKIRNAVLCCEKFKNLENTIKKDID